MSKAQRKPIAVILADTHMKSENAAINLKVFEEARQYAKSYGLNRVFHAGDIFDSRKAQTQDILNTFGTILDEFKVDQIYLSAIPGNHDKTDYKSAASFLDPFSEHPSFSLHRQFSTVSLPEGFLLDMMPFFSDMEYITALDQNVHKGKKLMLTHIGFNDATMNNGMKVSSMITDDLFKNYEKVFVGHYHDAFDYNKRVRYIGSSIQHNFGERPDKGLFVLYSDLSYEIVSLTAPKYMTRMYDAQDLTPQVIKELKAFKESCNDNLRIQITGTEEQVKSFNKQTLMAIGIKPEVKVDEIEAQELEERVTPFTDQTLKDAFTSFCEKNNLDLTQGLTYLNTIL